MKVEIAGHICCFGNRCTREVVDGCVAAAFEIESGLRGVDGAKKGSVSSEIDCGIAGQTIIGKVFCLAGRVDDTVATNGGRGAPRVERQACARSDVDFRCRISLLGAAAAYVDTARYV